MAQKFLCEFEKTELTKLTQEETENISSYIVIRKIKTVVKKPSHKEIFRPRWLHI